MIASHNMHSVPSSRNVVGTGVAQVETESVPLFSPSQIPSQEKVLHSIFSPSISGGVGRPRNESTTRSAEKTPAPSRMNRERTGLPSSSSASRARRKQKKRFSGNYSKSPYKKTPSYSASPYKKNPQPSRSSNVINEPHPQTLYSPSDGNNNDEFFSPRSMNAFTAISPLSFATCESFNTIPIDSLSYDFVKNCESEEELERIAAVLSPAHYPSLVRSVEKRIKAISPSPVTGSKLKKLASKDSPGETAEGEISLYYSPSATDRFPLKLGSSSGDLAPRDSDKATAVESRRNPQNPKETSSRVSESNRYESASSVAEGDERQESSLVMSLSSSLFDQVDTPDEKSVPLTKDSAIGANSKDEVTNQAKPNVFAPQAQGTTPLTHNCQGHDGDWATNAEVSRLVREKDETKARLLEEIRKLNEKVAILEGSGSVADGTLLSKVKELESSKDEANPAVSRLLNEGHRRTLLEREKFDKSNAESQKLSEKLKLERVEANGKLAEAKEREEELRQNVIDLSNKLADAEENILRARDSIRQELEEEASRERSSLTKSLQDAHKRLEEVQKDRNMLMSSVQTALGIDSSPSKILSLSNQSMIDRLSRKIASLRAASKALARSLATSENDRHAVIQERDEATKRVKQSSLQMRRLERENVLLSKKIQDLTDELESSRAYIDTLLAQARESNESGWDAREKEYKETIRKLKTQVLRGENMVSVALYRKAVDQARSRSAECEESRRLILDLSSKIQRLEKHLKERVSHSNEAYQVRPKPTTSYEKDHRSFTNDHRRSDRKRPELLSNTQKKDELKRRERKVPLRNVTANNVSGRAQVGLGTPAKGMTKHAKLEVLRRKRGVQRKVSPVSNVMSVGARSQSNSLKKTRTVTFCEKENAGTTVIGS